MDNRAGITTILDTLARIKKPPKQDIYVAFTTTEEIGGMGISFFTSNTQIDTLIAIDVGPVASEYQTKLSEDPIIVYKDSFAQYDKGIADRLRSTKIQTQAAIFERYGSDASIAASKGLVAKAALVAIPTENTHGFEIIHKNAIAHASRLLAEFLRRL